MTDASNKQDITNGAPDPFNTGDFVRLVGNASHGDGSVNAAGFDNLRAYIRREVRLAAERKANDVLRHASRLFLSLSE